MSTIGRFRSLDKAVRDSLWHEPHAWTIIGDGRVLVHDDGLELIKPVLTNRWTASKPLGYIRLSWWTHFVLNAKINTEGYGG